jgi:Double-GTPase 1
VSSSAGSVGGRPRISEFDRGSLAFVPVPRTSQIGDKDVTIHLVDRETGVQGAAFFPDLAGESFDTQVETRRCRPGFLENVAKGGGVLLFISADSKQDGLSIVELNAQFPDGDGDMIVGNVEEIEPSLENPAGVAEPQYQEAPIAAALPIPSRQPEWQPKMVLAQVRIVQLLSDLLRPPFTQLRRRLAVIISAWDLVPEGFTPDRWLSTQMPLVHQFLKANGDLFRTNLYGVSAQGLKLDDAAAVREASKLASSDRIRIVGPEGEGKDLTIPLVRLMSA